MEIDMNTWRTSIKELILNYKGALQAIIPWLENIKIPYLEKEAYDDWDSISQNLYQNLVVNTIFFSEELAAQLPFAKYDYKYECYKDLNFILCGRPNETNELIVFVSLSAEDNFDMVNTCIINKDNFNVIKKNKLKLSETMFYINYQNPSEYVTVDI